jgi:uncharacterized membrane protein HdeD (DUF308 family)
MIAFITKVISDNGLRNKLVQRGQVDENIKYLFLKPSNEFSLSSLKWGMVFVAIGIALFLKNIVPGMTDVMMMGWMFLLVGIAFVIYYFLAKNNEKKSGN